MRSTFFLWALVGGLSMSQASRAGSARPANAFEFKADRFADIQVLRYRVPDSNSSRCSRRSWPTTSTRRGFRGATFSGTRNTGTISRSAKRSRPSCAAIAANAPGRTGTHFVTYAKQVFFANGIHHHYASAKMLPSFPPGLSCHLAHPMRRRATAARRQVVADFARALTPILFDPKLDAKTVNLDAGIDNVDGSANNFYQGRHGGGGGGVLRRQSEGVRQRAFVLWIEFPARESGRQNCRAHLEGRRHVWPGD